MSFNHKDIAMNRTPVQNSSQIAGIGFAAGPEPAEGIITDGAEIGTLEIEFKGRFDYAKVEGRTLTLPSD